MHILCIIDVYSKCETMQLFSYIHTYITIDSSYINKTKSTTQVRPESQYHHKDTLKNKSKTRIMFWSWWWEHWLCNLTTCAACSVMCWYLTFYHFDFVCSKYLWILQFTSSLQRVHRKLWWMPFTLKDLRFPDFLK